MTLVWRARCLHHAAKCGLKSLIRNSDSRRLLRRRLRLFKIFPISRSQFSSGFACKLKPTNQLDLWLYLPKIVIIIIIILLDKNLTCPQISNRSKKFLTKVTNVDFCEVMFDMHPSNFFVVNWTYWCTELEAAWMCFTGLLRYLV